MNVEGSATKGKDKEADKNLNEDAGKGNKEVVASKALDSDTKKKVSEKRKNAKELMGKRKRET